MESEQIDSDKSSSSSSSSSASTSPSGSPTPTATSIVTNCKPISGADIISIRMISGRSIVADQHSSTSASAATTAVKPAAPTVFRAANSTGTGSTTTAATATAATSGPSTSGSVATMDPEPSTSTAGPSPNPATATVMLATSSAKIAKTSKLKFLILGSPKVGKTLILRRMQNINWPLMMSNAEYHPTIGPDLHRLKCGTIEAIDIGGQERLMPIARKYCELFSVFIIVFDMTDAETFLMARYWLDFIETSTVIQAKRILLIGNKMDLNKERKVSINLARNLAMTYEAEYLEISAKMDITMDKILDALQPTDSDKKNDVKI